MCEEKLDSVGGRIKHARGSMEQKEFAEFLGVARQTLIRYEKNDRKPDVDFITTLYEKCGIEPLWLLTGQGERGFRLSPREASLLENYRAIPDEEGKRYVEQSAQIVAPATTKDGAKPRTEKKKAC